MGPNGRRDRVVMTPKPAPYDVETAFPLARTPGVECVYMTDDEWLVTAVDILGRKRQEVRIKYRGAAAALARSFERSYAVEFLGWFW